MKVPRQRYKIYQAEEVVGYEGFFATVPAAQGYIDKIIRSKWWKDRSRIKVVKLNYPTYTMSGAFKLSDNIGEISIHAARLCETNIIHELAHLLVWIPGKDQERDHGPEFAGALLAMYGKFLSAGLRDRLQEEFESNGVEWKAYE